MGKYPFIPNTSSASEAFPTASLTHPHPWFCLIHPLHHHLNCFHLSSHPLHPFLTLHSPFNTLSPPFLTPFNHFSPSFLHLKHTSSSLQKCASTLWCFHKQFCKPTKFDFLMCLYFSSLARLLMAQQCLRRQKKEEEEQAEEAVMRKKEKKMRDNNERLEIEEVGESAVSKNCSCKHCIFFLSCFSIFFFISSSFSESENRRRNFGRRGRTNPEGTELIALYY